MARVALVVIFSALIVVNGYELDQASSLKNLLSTKIEKGEQPMEWLPIESDSSLESQTIDEDIGDMDNDLITGGLPGQPSSVNFNQYSGYIMVNKSHGRSLFYYFVEIDGHNSTSKPIVLWLNGGPGCSSLGNGAMVEHGPFGVRRDGKSLYARPSSWNKVANMLYLESPVGVGFSYSNTSVDYESAGDSRTAQDAYIFLIKWFKRFPQYRESDFYMAGESYAGYYIPELADIIQSGVRAHPFARIHLKGIMIGNGIADFYSDMTGIYDYLRTHALISSQTHLGLIQNCVRPIVSSTCVEFQERAKFEMGDIDLFNIGSEPCSTSGSNRSSSYSDITDPCQKEYVGVYLNLPHVQRALHANVTKLSYPWGLCSWVSETWTDSPSTVLPLYKKLITTGLRILLYSGDMDAVIPVTSTEYMINALNLTIENTWRPWSDGTTEQVAGYRVDYKGLIFATVRGAGHEVPRFQPTRAMALAKWFLDGV